MVPAIAAGVILLVSVMAFKRHLPYVGDRFNLKHPPAVVLAMEDTYLVGMDGKQKLWSLKARKVEISRDRSIATLTRITDGKIFDEGKVALKMTAGRAVYDDRREDLALSRGVAIEGREGDKVAAESVNWNSSTSVLRSTGPVRFERTWTKVAADDLEVDLKKKEMTMHNVRMSVDLREMERQAEKEAGQDAH